MLKQYLSQQKQVINEENQAYQSLINNVVATRNMGAWCSHQAEKPSVLLSAISLGALYGLAGGKATFAKAYASRRLLAKVRRSLRQIYQA